MEIYLVTVEDRYSDSSVYPFTDKDKAISEARRVAKKKCRYPERYFEEENEGGYIFYAYYSHTDEIVSVVAKTADKEID